MHYPNRDLVIWQMEFIDNKVTMAASNAISKVVDQIRALQNDITSLRSEVKNDINGLRSEMNENISNLRSEVKEEIHGLRTEMNTRFAVVETKLVAVETKLGISSTKQSKIADRALDYAFKAVWLVMLSIISYGVFKLH